MRMTKQLLDEALACVSAVADEGLSDGTKETTEKTVQELMVFVNAVFDQIKRVSIPHRLQPTFAGATLRHPQDCEAGYQIDRDHIVQTIEQHKADHRSRGLLEYYEKNLQELDERGPPKPLFLGNGIWESSENCSDQGLYIFQRYEDFDLNRDD